MLNFQMVKAYQIPLNAVWMHLKSAFRIYCDAVVFPGMRISSGRRRIIIIRVLAGKAK